MLGGTPFLQPFHIFSLVLLKDDADIAPQYIKCQPNKQMLILNTGREVAQRVEAQSPALTAVGLSAKLFTLPCLSFSMSKMGSTAVPASLVFSEAYRVAQGTMSECEPCMYFH